MSERNSSEGELVAVVLTHRRPRLATAVVRNLIEQEGLDPKQIVLVINGEGGLEDAELARQINTVTMTENTGPAGGFAAGISYFLEEFDSPWLYLSEDDVSLFSLPSPRIHQLVARAEGWNAEGNDPRIGGIVSYGRHLNALTGITTVHSPRTDAGFEPVDLAPWGASLISRDVLELGVSPRAEWFFGYEDFDFWLQVRGAGFSLLLDSEVARGATQMAFGSGRNESFDGERPTDADEKWRAYYVARNFIHFAREHGHKSWLIWHLLKSGRRWQLGRSRGERRAILAGLRAGFRGETGRNERYMRSTAEFSRQTG